MHFFVNRPMCFFSFSYIGKSQLAIVYIKAVKSSLKTLEQQASIPQRGLCNEIVNLTETSFISRITLRAG